MRPRETFLILAISFWSSLSPASAETALDRILAAGMRSAKWSSAKSLTERLQAIRDEALKQDVVSRPVSDRYQITVLGGPIDLVHFLGLAYIVCSGSSDREQALLEQWTREGGPDFEKGLSRTYPTEAHPDDLPSNALGALLGEELRPHNLELDFDLPGALRRFFSSLEPVPNQIAHRFSHTQIVMGLRESSSVREFRSRSEWFTAQPMYILPAVAPERAARIPDSVAALKAAGFVVRKYQGRPIVIDRLPAPPIAAIARYDGSVEGSMGGGLLPKRVSVPATRRLMLSRCRRMTSSPAATAKKK